MTICSAKKALVSLFLSTVMFGCHTGRASQTQANVSFDREELLGQLEFLEERLEAEQARAHELEVQLALIQTQRAVSSSGGEGASDVQGVVGEVSLGQQGIEQSNAETREGPVLTNASNASNAESSNAEQREADDEGPRPMLRLYGTGTGESYTALPVSSVPTAVPLSAHPVSPLSVAPRRPGHPTGSPEGLNQDGRLFQEGLLRVRQGEIGEAARIFASIQTGSYADDASFWLAELKWVEGHKRAAKIAFERFLQMYPHSTKRALALKRLEECQR